MWRVLGTACSGSALNGSPARIATRCSTSTREICGTSRRCAPAASPPLIPLGTTGTFAGTSYTVIGFLVRSVTEEGTVYRWQEYLLYNPSVGFRWLVHSDDHWNFVSRFRPEKSTTIIATRPTAGKAFRLFGGGLATVRSVLGEFYWKVEVGEEVQTRDLIHPPEALSIETAERRTEYFAGDLHAARPRSNRPSA